MNHVIKIYAKHATNVRINIKPWETRKNDRDYKSDDTVTMLEIRDYNKEASKVPIMYTGHVIKAKITMVSSFGCIEGFVNFGLSEVESYKLDKWVVDMLNEKEAKASKAK